MRSACIDCAIDMFPLGNFLATKSPTIAGKGYPEIASAIKDYVAANAESIEGCDHMPANRRLPKIAFRYSYPLWLRPIISGRHTPNLPDVPYITALDAAFWKACTRNPDAKEAAISLIAMHTTAINTYLSTYRCHWGRVKKDLVGAWG